MTVGQRIKHRRKELGFSADKLGELIGKNRATIYRYENNDIENMPYDVVEPLANALQVSPAYIMGWTTEKLSVVAEENYPYIAAPISAGMPETVESLDELSEITMPNSIMGKYAGHRDIQIMRINGESMNRVIPNGSLIAVKRIDVCNINDGDIVVYRDNYEYAVKRMFRSNKQIIFRPDSTNPSFVDYVADADERLDILGKVVVYIVELD